MTVGRGTTYKMVRFQLGLWTEHIGLASFWTPVICKSNKCTMSDCEAIQNRGHFECQRDQQIRYHQSSSAIALLDQQQEKELSVCRIQRARNKHRPWCCSRATV